MESGKFASGTQSSKRTGLQSRGTLFIPGSVTPTTPTLSSSVRPFYPSYQYQDIQTYQTGPPTPQSFQTSGLTQSSGIHFVSSKPIREASKERGLVPLENRLNALSRVMGKYIPENQLESVVYNLKPYQLDQIWDYAWPQIMVVTKAGVNPFDQDTSVYRMENFASVYSLPRKDIEKWKNKKFSRLLVEAIRQFILNGKTLKVDPSLIYNTGEMQQLLPSKLVDLETLILIDGDNLGLIDQNWSFTALPLLRLMEFNPYFWTILVYRHGALPGYLQSFVSLDKPNESIDLVWSSTNARDAADHVTTALGSFAHIYDSNRQIEFNLVTNDHFSTEWIELFSGRKTVRYMPRQPGAGPWILRFLRQHPTIQFSEEWLPFWNRFKPYLNKTGPNEMAALPDKYLNLFPTDREYLEALIGERALCGMEIRNDNPSLQKVVSKLRQLYPQEMTIQQIITQTPSTIDIGLRVQSLYLIYNWIDFWSHPHIADAFGLKILRPYTELAAIESDYPDETSSGSSNVGPILSPSKMIPSPTKTNSVGSTQSFLPITPSSTVVSQTPDSSGDGTGGLGPLNLSPFLFTSGRKIGESEQSESKMTLQPIQLASSGGLAPIQFGPVFPITPLSLAPVKVEDFPMGNILARARPGTEGRLEWKLTWIN